MKLCYIKNLTDHSLRLYETFYSPVKMLSVDFYKYLLGSLIKANRIEDCYFILRQFAGNLEYSARILSSTSKLFEEKTVDIYNSKVSASLKGERTRDDEHFASIKENQFHKRKNLLRFEALRSNFLKQYHQSHSLANIADVYANLVTIGDCLFYSQYVKNLRQPNSTLIKTSIQVQNVFVRWMYDNNIEAILTNIVDTRWLRFVPESLILPLARFLSNHGHLEKAVEFLNAKRDEIYLQSTIFDFLIVNRNESVNHTIYFSKRTNVTVNSAIPRKLDFSCLLLSTDIHRYSNQEIEKQRKYFNSFLPTPQLEESLNDNVRKVGG